jgi:glycosyltransferase involved in cell wall biosynthesis
VPSERRELDVLLVGPYPPPLGGVSSHVRRVAAEMQAAGYRLGVIDHFGGRHVTAPVVASLRRNPGRYLLELSRWRAQVVHYHHAGRTSILVAAALARQTRRESRWLITVHNHSLTPPRARGRSRLIRWALNQFDDIIAVSPEVQLGLTRHVPERTISVLPAFCGIADQQTSSLSDETRRFVGSGGVTVVVSAYRVRPFRGGGDLYGLGFAARVFELLAAEMGDVKLAVFVAHRAHSRVARRYLSDCYRRLAREYPGRVHLAVGEPLVQALGPGTIYLRPTSSDGDAVSVREALALGVPVLASDVAQRPPGVRVLPVGDRSRWVEAVGVAVMAARSHRSPPPRPAAQNRDLAALLAVYDRNVAPP